MKLARVTKEPVLLSLVNLGDFGGTFRVYDSWHLEIKGPYDAMKAWIPIFKKYKMVWEPRAKVWQIHAELTSRNSNQYEQARRNQNAAYKELKPLVDTYNREAQEFNKGVSPSRPTSPRDIENHLRSQKRFTDSLEDSGLRLQSLKNNPYGNEEYSLVLTGNTYSIKDALKSLGFRFHPGSKGWVIPFVEYVAIEDKFKRAIGPMLRTPQPQQTSGFSLDIGSREFDVWAKQVSQALFDMNEGWDGEPSLQVSSEDIRREMMRLKGKALQDAYDRYNKVLYDHGRGRYAAFYTPKTWMNTHSDFVEMLYSNGIIIMSLKNSTKGGVMAVQGDLMWKWGPALEKLGFTFDRSRRRYTIDMESFVKIERAFRKWGERNFKMTKGFPNLSEMEDRDRYDRMTMANVDMASVDMASVDMASVDRVASRSVKTARYAPVQEVLVADWNHLHDITYGLKQALGEYDIAASYVGGRGSASSKAMIKSIQSLIKTLDGVSRGFEKLLAEERKYVNEFGYPDDYSHDQRRQMFPR